MLQGPHQPVMQVVQHWNLSFANPDMFKHKYEVLLGHCDAVGRDPNEILRSVQLALPADEAPEASAERAAALEAVGCQKVIFSLRPSAGNTLRRNRFLLATVGER